MPIEVLLHSKLMYHQLQVYDNSKQVEEVKKAIAVLEKFNKQRTAHHAKFPVNVKALKLSEKIKEYVNSSTSKFKTVDVLESLAIPFKEDRDIRRIYIKYIASFLSTMFYRNDIIKERDGNNKGRFYIKNIKKEIL